jgi:sugar phosphate isomerase/epimerase
VSVQAQPADPPALRLAVRLMSYGDYQDAAWTHLPALGVKYLFMQTPSPDQVDAVISKLKANKLEALVLRGSAELSKESFVEDLKAQLDICRTMGVHYMFLSAKRGEASKEVAYERLRAAGDEARARDVVIALETHPDLGTNGDVQIETMRAIDHPNVRVNFDTANITYYNENTTALDELKKSIAYVATFELKDHMGGLESWDFPVLGKGKVDFRTILETLRENAYAGPVTIEFEGTKGVTLTQEQTLQAIADSVAYARTLTNFE